ncbi:hypothetical protein DAEQUDRAFT_771043 [Daedalea quercina L-15889]|uniref:Uncharacterized protein n=1 Tax=Daedalea quercina L-15889 TaxID=1314783 RepID=A0A165KE91_9APHY|nr:hypothetical protein DAEQUDRAFT_771044 [Daedalea quercina L-15889]KZT63021.1 hypothetical protein DAEQUDRAFT_771043 [Daedalea quercina L-15889]
MDIDVAWHTHQLTVGSTVMTCESICDLNNYSDDKVKDSEKQLEDGFNLTSQVWQEHFNVPYTHCGCSLPGETISSRLQHLKYVSTSRDDVQRVLWGNTGYGRPRCYRRLPALARLLARV